LRVTIAAHTVSPAAPTPIDPHLLTTEEVMERLLASPHLKRIAATCVLPAVRHLGEWRFRRSDLEQWILRQYPVASTAKPGDQASPFS
jgi:hypothetical protein